MAFLAISDQYTNYIFFFTKCLAVAILDHRKSLSITFLSISYQYTSFFFEFFSKWTPLAILEVRFGPFWITENHFWSYFSPFQINTQLYIFLFFKMAAGGHFGSPICAKSNRVLPLCVINGYAQYELISEFMTKLEMPQAFWAFYTKWPPEAILFFRLMPKIIGFLYSGTSMQKY